MQASSYISKSQYRADIDGLRGIAVLLVVAFHAFPGRMPGGFIGVDIFFVISGFLISRIIFNNLSKGTFSFVYFYARRIKRIFPSLLIILLFFLVLGYFFLVDDEYEQLGKHSMSGILFISNFVLWNESGYFDNDSKTKPFLHLWSLSIEEQFYLVWPLILYYFWKFKKRMGGGVFFLFLLTLTLLSLWLNIATADIDKVNAFYSPLTRFWELLFGALLAYWTLYVKVLHNNIVKNCLITNTLSLLGIVAIGFGSLFFNKSLLFPGFYALIPVIGAGFIILFGSHSFFNHLFLSNKLAVWFGLISYPLYLWHWPILTFFHMIEEDLLSTNYRLIAVILSIFLAWLTYYFIEKNVRNSSIYRYLVTIVFFSILIFFTGYKIYSNNGLPERKAVTNSNFSKEVRYQFMGPLWPYKSNDICRSKYPYKDQDSLAWWFCISNSEKPPTILLLGNSHSNALYPGFARNPRLNHHSVISIGNCDIVFYSGNDPTHPCYGERWLKEVDFINNIIKNTPSLQYVIVNGLSRKPTLQYINEAINRISFLEKSNLKVVIFIPHLLPGFHPKSCFKLPLKKNPRDCLTSKSNQIEILDNFTPLINALKNSNPKTVFFNPNDIFCDRNDDFCSYIRNGLPLHRDEGHLSEYGSVLLQDYFNKFAEVTLNQIFNLRDQSDK